MAVTVAVIAPGAMGAAVGKRLVDNGATVVTALAGRSAASVKRAQAAGMQPASDTEIAAADFILSIVPPGEAVSLAQRLAPALAASARKPIYVDCNAVSPSTVAAIAAPVIASGARYVDAGIIGPPPGDGLRTVLYVSGPDAREMLRLGDHGLTVTPLEGPLSGASALKMSYGGITKGMTAIATAMLLAATRGGTAPALRDELQVSFPPFPWITRQVPGMYHRAYRWVAEMEEIATFAGEDAATRDMYLSIAKLFDRMAQDNAGERREIAMLDAFFKPPR